MKHMTIIEAIDIRRSRRKYLRTPISAENVSRLQQSIDQYNQEAGLRFQLILNSGGAFKGFKRSYGLLTGVENYLALVGSQKDPDIHEKTGRYGELLVLEATTMGLGTCWIGGAFEKESCVCDVGEDEDFICVIPIGNVEKSQSVKERLVSGAMHRKSKTSDELLRSDCEVPEWMKNGMQAVMRAPSGLNLQPVGFSYQNGILQASVEPAAGEKKVLEKQNEMNLIELGIAKLHFELGAGKGKWAYGNSGQFTYGEEWEGNYGAQKFGILIPVNP